MARISGGRILRSVGAVLVLAATLPFVCSGGPAAAVPPPTCGSSTVTVTRVSSPVLYLETGTTLNSMYAGYRIANSTGSAYSDLWVQLGGFGGTAKIKLATSESGLAHPGRVAAGASTTAFFYLTATEKVTSAETHTLSVYTTRPDLAGAAMCTSSFSLTSDTDIEAAANKVTSVTASPSTPQLGGRLTVTVIGDTGQMNNPATFAASPASYSTWPAGAFRLVGSSIVMTGGNSTTITDNLFPTGLAQSDTHYVATYTFAVTGTTATSTPVSPMNHISSGNQIKHTKTDTAYTALSPIPPPVNNTTLGLTVSPAGLPGGGTVTYTVPVQNAGTVDVTLDDITVTLPASVSVTAGTSAWNGSTITDPTVSGTTATFLGTLTVAAGTTRNLTFQATIPAPDGLYTASAFGHFISTTIDTTTSTGDSTPATATVVNSPPPTVTSLSPATGVTLGGTTVVITGTNLSGATAVHFGAVAVTSFTVDSNTQITATAPAGTGTVDVTVTTPIATSATVPGDQYTYTSPPAAPTPPALTSTGIGTADQTTTITIPTSGTATLLNGATPATSVTTSEGTYTLSGSTITFTPVLGFSGQAAPVTYRVADQYGQTGSSTYTPTVTKPTGPTPPALTSTGIGTADQTATVTIPTSGAATLLDGATPANTVTTAEGTYVLSGTTITFTPVLGFSGQAASPVTYRITDAYAQNGTNTYTPTVTKPGGPTPPALTSTGVGTAAQTATVTIPTSGAATLLDGSTPASSVTTAEGTYTLAGTTITFTPVLGFSGQAASPVTYRVTDAYAQNGTNTYTPTVTKPGGPTPPALTSTGVGTADQTTTVTIPASGTATLLDGATPANTVTTAEGTYVLSGTTITFTPVLGFSGQAASPVTYRITDAYAQNGSNTYTPT
ncbi:beta strand repeat-containing protein, partial [Virgisporangium aliadipatigenens]|uniref:beta strand repeat-containing protein n=1 Tax=Virgisporangium aliadipatigenens TaxID=741659 RepID=UPI001940B55F